MKERSVDLSTFKKIQDEIIAANEETWNRYYNKQRSTSHIVRDYKPEEIDKIINTGSIDAQRDLSRAFFERKSLYRRIIFYYATLLTYQGILIPNPSFGKKLSTPHIAKRYYNALDYLDKLNLQEVLTRVTIKALVDGCYYGVIITLTKDEFVMFDLPNQYCRSRFKDFHGNDIVEFDVSYFNTIIDEDLRKAALATYPEIVRRYYRKWMSKGSISPWIRLPAEIGICFSFFEIGGPLFLDVIPATIQYEDAVDTERDRELEEIRKIIVQKIPHLTDGTLLFEPDEALEMHRGAVNMMRGNKNLSILTTYADVDAIISKTTADNVSTSLEKMLQNVYSEAGASVQIFSPTGSQALETSIRNDMALMMILGTKYSRFISYIINTLFANSNITFKYSILPITYYNQSDYLKDTFKLAQSGYSFILPALGSGLSQKELSNVKELENDLLKLHEKLLPLSSAYTSTGDVGRPPLDTEDKALKTIQNEESLDHQGGSDE